MSEVQRFLNSRHPNKYRVYNLCSERAYPPQRFAHPEAPDGTQLHPRPASIEEPELV